MEKICIDAGWANGWNKEQDELIFIIKEYLRSHPDLEANDLVRLDYKVDSSD